MKFIWIKTLVVAVLATFSVRSVIAYQLAKERPYEFRKHLEVVHEPNRFDPKAKATADEFVFRDGVSIRLEKSADRDFVFRAAQDFQDYLAVSMGVSAGILRPTNAGPSTGGVSISLDPSLPPRTCVINTDRNAVRVKATDERAAAQALYHLEDAMNLRRAPFLKFGERRLRARFSPRMTHSGWHEDIFPDAHLKQIAHAGMDAILVFVRGIDKTKGNPKYHDINNLIRRAKYHGLDTYIYSFIRVFAHPADPGGKEKLEKAYGGVAKCYPEAKGIVFVGESCEFPTKDKRAQPRSHRNRKPGDKRPLAGWWPCSDYPEWLRAIKAAINVHNPNMDIVMWSYNWGYQPYQPRMEFIDALPKDVTLMATFEMFENVVKRNGYKIRCADYSLSFAGPGKYFISEAERAHKAGLKLYTMSSSGGLTWDFGTIPYQPCPYQWNKRYKALVEAQEKWGLSGLMESHHYGWWPSFIAEIEKNALTEGGMPFEEHIRAIAVRDFGEKNADAALAAWKGFSDAICDYVASNENQYGPFRIGPAYPFNFGGKEILPKDVPYPRHATFGPRICKLNYELRKGETPEIIYSEIELLNGMVEKFGNGATVFTRIADSLPPARAEKAARMANLARYMQRTFMTAINVKKGCVAHLKGDKAELMKLAKAEYANALATIPLVEVDSRLGWEPSMQYMGGPDQIRWKLNLMEKLYGKDVTVP